MSDNSCIAITMLGGFSITNSENSIDDKSKHSKKCLYLLEYLVAHRHSGVTRDDLIEILWPEETSENPTGALKTLLHRARTLLKSIDLPKEIIFQRNNTYLWNNSFPCSIDIEQFEQLYQKIKTTTDSSKLLSLFSQATALYTGDFLPQSAYEPWVVPINTYYHTLYLKLTYDYINLLMMQHDYTSISALCCKALSIDNYDEDLHYYFILSLYRCGKTSVACKQYETSSNLLYNKYNAPPSKRFLSLYREIHPSPANSEHNLLAIQKNLQAGRANLKVFRCDYELFQEVYQIETYAYHRLGEPLFLCLFTLTSRIHSKVNSSTIAKAMEILYECFQRTLEERTIISQYSSNQYVLLLPAITLKQGQDYIKKIAFDFNTYPFKSFLQLESSLLPAEGIKT